MSAAIIDIYHAAPTAEPVQRRALYDGKLCAVSATAASKNFGQTVRHAIGRELEIAIDAFDLRHPQLQQAETYRQLAPIRQWLKESKESKMLVVDWLTDILGDVDQYAIDYPRLRMLPPAQCATQPGPAMFMMHRDVWYANSQSQINVWMPLHALDKRQSFAFYPHWFDAPVANSSAKFSYDEWVKNVGWQSQVKNNSAAEYPSGEVANAAADMLQFTLEPYASLCFSAQHLHAPQPNPLDHPRLSIDIRCVHRADHANGIGAENTDNLSRGDATRDYRYLDALRYEAI